MNTHRCVWWAAVAGLLGIAWNAWAQDAAAPVTAGMSDPTMDFFARLIQGGGLPAVLGALGWLAGRGSLQLPIAGSLTLALHDEDRKILKRIARSIDDGSGPITQPGVVVRPRNRDDSEE